jgi:leucyl aminopeptidase
MHITITQSLTDVVLIPLKQDDSLANNLALFAERFGFSTQVSVDFKADAKETLLLYTSDTKVFLLGLGKNDNSNELIRVFRTFFNAQKSKLSTCVTIMCEHLPEAFIEWATNGFVLASYNFKRFGTDQKAVVDIFGEKGQLNFLTKSDHAEAFVNKGKATAETQLEVFELMNAPSNYKYPEILANWAIDSAQKFGYSATVLNKTQLESLGFKALLAVNKGAEHEPVCIIAEYKHPEATQKIGLVGKGVTFDTGGISLKDSNNMHLMKSDMGGAGAVLGTVELVAKLGLKVHLIGIVPSTENCIDGNATRPGDVIGTYSGKTIEVIDTDAEGRLILADALGYMVRNYAPDVMIDLATLTGSIIGTLGYHAAGLFTTSSSLATDLVEVANQTGERLWQLPMWEIYEDELKSDIADVKNYHGKPFAGAIVAAKFLEIFAEKHPKWAHIDIAGTAFGDTDFAPGRAGTAYGVRLLTAYLEKVQS